MEPTRIPSGPSLAIIGQTQNKRCSQGINRSCWVYVGRGDACVALNRVNVTSGNVLNGIECNQVVLIAEVAGT